MVVDALTCNQDEIWRMSLEDSEPWGCTCLAKEDPAVRHSHTCGVRPIYAELFRIYERLHQDPHSINNELLWAKGGIKQTVIKCALCGRERLGRDMDVIYQAPLRGTVAHDIGMSYKYPHNIVKAVCPEHNRKGTSRVVAI
jgi:hypothetical protein